MYKMSFQIQLGDYCLPPDKKEETLGGIKSCRTSEYADPYETKQIVEGIVQFLSCWSIDHYHISELIPCKWQSSC